MKRIHILPEELYHSSSFLTGIMEMAFDASCIMDQEGRIIACSDSSPLIWGRPNSESIGMHISELDPNSPYPDLLKDGKARLGRPRVINGILCLTHMIPLFDYSDHIIGAFGTINMRGSEKIKTLIHDISSIWTQLPENSATMNRSYNQMARSAPTYSLSDFIGKTPVAKQLISLAKRVSSHSCTVLIRGETGCGKEIIANGIHAASYVSSNRPFVKINCAAIPKDLLESELFGYEKGAFSGAFAKKIGKFEIVGNGTILLDEIGDMDIALQSKLLRVLEEKEFERIGGNTMIPFYARVIAVTNSNLEEKIEKNLFRADLYYRLSSIEISIPPLRERREDIPLIANHFLTEMDINRSFSTDALQAITEYSWPGNVRQLKNIITKMVISEDKMIFDKETVCQYLPKDSINISSSAISDPLANMEKQLIMETLQNYNFNLSASAKALGISRNTLYARMRRYNIATNRQFASSSLRGEKEP